MANVNEEAIALHKKFHGKLETVSKVPLKTNYDLTLAYTPGVAAPCIEIAKEPDKIYDYTNRGNLVAVVTNGTAVLGLGNILWKVNLFCSKVLRVLTQFRFALTQ